MMAHDRSRRPHLVSWSSLALLILASLSAGCSSDETSPKVVDPPAGYASSPDDAVRFLRNAYSNLDLDGMDKVLAPQFQFELAPDDVDTLKIDSTWDRSTHMLWAEHAFSGMPGIRADGSVQNPVMTQGLEVLWTPSADDTTGWTEISEGPWANTLEQNYDSFSSVQYLSFDFDFVEGVQTLNVVARDLPVGDAVARIYQVARWRSGVPGAPPPSARKHGTISWGRFIAKFRFDEILESPPGYATSANDVLQRVHDALVARDLDALGRLLHEKFQFELASDDADTLKIGPGWDRDTQLQWLDNLFSGKPGQRADGSAQPPLDTEAGMSGSWPLLENPTGWTLVSQGPYINTLQQSFQSEWTVPYVGGDSDTIAGFQTFNVTERVLPVQGGLARVHQLIRWAAATPSATSPPTLRTPTPQKGETISWGLLFAMFRFD